MKIVVLGAGLVGGPMAVDLAIDSEYKVTVADINQNALDNINKQNPIELIQKDLSKENELITLISDFELVINAVPGFMGLNVVHMMSLSLPVLTHAEIKKHMGPEPEYIRHGDNGWFYGAQNDLEALKTAIVTIWQMPVETIVNLQKNAFASYQFLSTPPYHQRLLNVLEVSKNIR